MTYQFHIRTPSTAGVQMEATVLVEDNRPDRTEELRQALAEFYKVPTMWVLTEEEYHCCSLHAMECGAWLTWRTPGDR